MDNEATKKLIDLIKKDRKKVLQILMNLFKNFNGRIKVPNELLEELFIKKESKTINGEEILISEFIVTEDNKQLYNFFNFEDFKYENLYIKADKIDGNTLDLMRNNGIPFYTNNIINKKINNQQFKDIIIDGNFDGWNIEGDDFTGCIGSPKINPNKTSNKSIKNVILKDTTVSGNCNEVDITGASFENAVISKEFSINPQKVKNKDLSRAVFSGVKLIGSFDGTIINGTNFNNCETDLVLNLDKIDTDYEKKSRYSKELKYNKFGGITFKGNLTEFELISNDFTGSKNAVIDFDKLAHIHISSKWNNFSDVTFKNIHRVSEHFIFDNGNKFANAIVLYNSFNCDYELRWYEQISGIDDYEKIKMINEDEIIEEEIKQIINPEIEKQKTKKKKSN